MDRSIKNIKNLNILTWNANGLLRHKSEFQHFLHIRDIHIAIIFERHFNPNTKFRIPNYNINRYDRIRNTPSGRAAIIIKSIIIHHQATPIFTTLTEHIAVKFEANTESYTIVAIYDKPTDILNKLELTQAFTLHKNLMISGDIYPGFVKTQTQTGKYYSA